MSTPSTASAPIDSSSPPLRRRQAERIVAGVCAGIARSLGTTSLIVRIVALLVAVTSPPIALIAYAALAIAIPRDDGRQLLGGDPQDTRETVIGWSLVVAALIAVAAGFESTFFGGPGGVILLAGGLVALVVHHQRRSGRQVAAHATPASAAIPAPVSSVTPTDVTPPPRRRFESPYPGPVRPVAMASVDAAAATMPLAPPTPASPTPSPAPPAGPREVSVALIGLCAIVAAATVAILLSATGAIDATARGVAVALGTGALALTVGAVVFARRRGAVALVVFAVLLALGSLASATVGDHVEDGVGERVETPLSEAELAREYELGIGSLTIDLTDAQLDPGITTVHGRLGIGEMVFRVPRGVRVTSVGPDRVGGMGAVNALAGSNPTRTIQIDAEVDHGSVDVEAVGADGP